MQNLVSFFGIFFFIGCAWLLSENRRAFPWRVVGWGLALQFFFGFLVLWWEPGSRFFLQLNDVFNALARLQPRRARRSCSGRSAPTSMASCRCRSRSTSRGSAPTRTDPLIQTAIRTGTVPGFILALQVLTTIIFFSALLSVLYYFGVMQKIVDLFARIMAKTMGVSGAEALSNSANIFVGQTEAPLVVRPFIAKMTRSELMAIMVGGFANTAGGVLGAYVLMLSGYFPNIAAHLISASVLSAPAAFIMAKVMVPERETADDDGHGEDGCADRGRQRPGRGRQRLDRRLAADDQRHGDAARLHRARGDGQHVGRLGRRTLPRRRGPGALRSGRCSRSSLRGAVDRPARHPRTTRTSGWAWPAWPVLYGGRPRIGAAGAAIAATALAVL